ncbi:MAG: helix-turn-helix domain-containing protein, partial [Planctomycetes bacterium]|nr:helix-turn-helix domain-containing protein [Planctomycetota bacterium]
EAALVLAVLQGWAEWTAAGTAAAGAAVHPGVARAAELLAGDPALALPALARASGLGGDLLGRLFRRELGLTLTAFRQQCRLERYQRLRGEHPRRTLLWCALAAGFGSYAQFHRVHRLQLGRSPRQD